MQMDTAGYLSIIGTLPVFAKVYLLLTGWLPGGLKPELRSRVD
jgi:hypothetical protein